MSLDTIRQLISTHYVFEELRGPLVAALDRSERAGAYDTADTDQFAARVTEDLRQVAHDGHLYLRRDPARYTAMTAPTDNGEALVDLKRSRAIERNHGLVEMSIRPANIRYLKVAGFDWVDDGSTTAAYAGAAAFLADGDALILDLRGNGGGQSDAADTFTNGLLRALQEKNGRPRPIYILVDGDTGSAAEAVAYDAQVRHLAILVGARTYGAANNVEHYPVTPDLVLSLSYNRPLHPVTGTNWEGVGVTPDNATAPALALEHAELLALTALANELPTESSSRVAYEWRAAGIRARIDPPQNDPATLETLAGQYQTIEIRHDAEGLSLYRPERPRWPAGVRLRPMTSEGLFSMEGTDDLRVQFRDGRLIIVRPTTAPEFFQRTD